MERTEYADKLILSLRQKYKEKQSGYFLGDNRMAIGSKQIIVHREELFNGICSIMLPEIMEDMEYAVRIVKYPRQNRPQIIKTDHDSGATITFSLVSAENIAGKESASVQMEKLGSDIKRMWKQNVFYDKGEVRAGNLSVAWMDFKAFCLDGSLYSIIFLFQMEQWIVLGNFHCAFPKYDIWKPVVLSLLTTIQGGNGNERVPD